eukprot:8835977-Alexandrium_andersonii.AAC.1
MSEARLMPIHGHGRRPKEPPLEVSGPAPRRVLLEPEQLSALMVKGIAEAVRRPGGRDCVAP